SRLIIVVERCTNDHNYSAILRTVEALGVATVYMIDPPDELNQRRLHHIFARNATEWITVRDFETVEDCVACCRKQGYKLWVTDLSQAAEALDLSPDPSKPLRIPDKIALVFGTEAVGASNYILEQADKRVYLPLRGFADSLNLSVSTALVTQALFFLDPSLIGAMSEGERKDMRKAWFTKLAQQRLLTSKQKKDRKILGAKMKKCETLNKRIQDDPDYYIQPGEQKKLDEWSSYQRELESIEALIDPVKVQIAVQEWIDNPPVPLTDLRRADTHRVCFVGKNTRHMHKEHW
ncbi:SpoU_methylase-domain-containing protein, partial [Fragilariopsis cylindrus CCMP1102]